MNPTIPAADQPVPADKDLAEQAYPGHGIPSQDLHPGAQTTLDPAEAKREANSVLAGGGVMVGVVTGAAIGTAVAGPVGAVVGGTVGAVAGALGGAAASTLVDPATPSGIDPSIPAAGHTAADPRADAALPGTAAAGPITPAADGTDGRPRR